jgi:hypothetical protein
VNVAGKVVSEVTRREAKGGYPTPFEFKVNDEFSGIVGLETVGDPGVKLGDSVAFLVGEPRVFVFPGGSGYRLSFPALGKVNGVAR